MSNQTHINVIIQDAEDAYNALLTAAGAFKDKVDVLKARYEADLKELSPIVQQQAETVASEVTSDVNAVAADVTKDIRTDEQIAADVAAQDEKKSDTKKK